MKNEEQFWKFVKKTNDDPLVEERRELGFDKYGDLFKTSNIEEMDIEKFRKFFNYKENQHWGGLNQNITLLISNPKNLKESLKVLLDEHKPISERINRILDASGESKVKGYGLARISAILHYAHPDKYGAYNNVSLEGLSKIGENPKDINNPRWNSLTNGERYNLVNQKLLELSKTYNISLWAIDWVWWDLVNNFSDGTTEEDESDETTFSKKTEDEKYRFALEKHLEEFLVENWENTMLYKDLQLDIVKDEESGQSIGIQYRLLNGKRVDILCKNRKPMVLQLLNLSVGARVLMYWVKSNYTWDG